MCAAMKSKCRAMSASGVSGTIGGVCAVVGSVLALGPSRARLSARGGAAVGTASGAVRAAAGSLSRGSQPPLDSSRFVSPFLGPAAVGERVGARSVGAPERLSCSSDRARGSDALRGTRASVSFGAVRVDPLLSEGASVGVPAVAAFVALACAAFVVTFETGGAAPPGADVPAARVRCDPLAARRTTSASILRFLHRSKNAAFSSRVLAAWSFTSSLLKRLHSSQ